jgi:hypothetical protein
MAQNNQNLNSLNVNQLQNVCRSHNLTGYSMLNKTNLIELIKKKLNNPNFQVTGNYYPNWVESYQYSSPNGFYNNNSLVLDNNEYNRIKYKGNYYKTIVHQYAPRASPAYNTPQYPYLCYVTYRGLYEDILKTRINLGNIETIPFQNLSPNNRNKL